MAYDGRGGGASASRSEDWAADSVPTAPLAAQAPLLQASQPVVLTSAFDQAHPRWPYQGTPVGSLAMPIGVVPAERFRRPAAPLGLRLAVVGLALLAACSLGSLLALHDRPQWFTKLRNSVPLGGTVPSRSAVQAPTTTVPTSTANGLTISSIVPATGRGGQRVAILGSHLLGPGGYLVATFGGAVVPTSCPSEDECDAVVPAQPPGSKTAAVQVRTKSGVSNALTFRYR